MKRGWLAVALFSLWAGCQTPAVESAAITDGGPRRSVTSRTVRARSPEGLSFLEVPGLVVLAPDAIGVVTMPVDGRILELLVRPGAQVTRGAPIARVLLPAAVRAAGELAAARTRVSAYAAREEQLDRLKADGMARMADVSEARTRLAEARADEISAGASLRAAGVSTPEAAQLLALGGVMTLRSPIAGVVVEAQAAVGEHRGPAGLPLARVVGTRGPRVEAKLSQRLPSGARAEFLWAGQLPCALEVIDSAPEVGRDGTIAAWFEPRGCAGLASGQPGTVRLHLAPEAGVVAVPAAAVAQRAGRSFVIARDGERERVVDVEIIAQSGADAVVRGALKIGDTVAAEAHAPSGGTP